MFATIHKIFYGVAWLLAVIGGAVLSALVLMLCLSILGRTASTVLHSDWMEAHMAGLADWLLGIGVGPIFGDYELLTAGLAFCVFCFLGWCQITGGHATVDVFTAGLRERPRRVLQMLSEILFAVALVVIAKQLYVGMDSLERRHSITYLLQYPAWWNYALSLGPAVIAAAIGVYMALVRTAEAVLNRSLVTTAGADH